MTTTEEPTRGVKRRTSLIDEYPNINNDDPESENDLYGPATDADVDENDEPETQTKPVASEEERLEELVDKFDPKSLQPRVLRTISMQRRAAGIKSVCFAEGENGGVKCNVRVVDRFEEPDLWWKKADMRRIRKRCRDQVSKVRENSKEYVDLMEETVDRYDKEGDEAEDRRKLLQTLIRTYEARGLESHVLENTTRLCKRHGKAVVRATRSSDLSDEGVRNVSLITSRGSRCFAIRLAECDRLKVQLAQARANSRSNKARSVSPLTAPKREKETFKETPALASTKQIEDKPPKIQVFGNNRWADPSQTTYAPSPNDEPVPDCCESSVSTDENSTVPVKSALKQPVNRSISDDSDLTCDSLPADPRNGKGGKSVHFSNQPEGDLEIDTLEFENDNNPTMWWNTKEITRIRKECRLVVMRYQIRNREYIDTITKALERQTDASPELTRSEVKAEDRKLLQKLVLNEDSRGLEQHIVEHMSILSRKQVLEVLKASRDMKGQNNDENAEKALAELSEKLSKPFHFLAQRLGGCDWLKSKQAHAKMQGELLRKSGQNSPLVQPQRKQSMNMVTPIEQSVGDTKSCTTTNTIETAISTVIEEARDDDAALVAALKGGPSRNMRNLMWRHSNVDALPDALLPGDGDMAHGDKVAKILSGFHEENSDVPISPDSISPPTLLRLARDGASVSEAERKVDLPGKKPLVRFAEEDDGKVMVTTKHVESNDDPGLWWSNTELSEIRQDCCGVVQSFQQSNSSYTASLMEILDTEPSGKTDGRKILQELLLNYDARGLERHLLPQLRERGRSHVKYVVEENQRLSEDEDRRETDIPILLRQRSLVTGQASGTLALKLAACDWLKSQQEHAKSVKKSFGRASAKSSDGDRSPDCALALEVAKKDLPMIQQVRWKTNKKSSDSAPRRASRRSSIEAVPPKGTSVLPSTPKVEEKQDEENSRDTSPVPQRRLLSRASSRTSIKMPGEERTWQTASRKNLMAGMETELGTMVKQDMLESDD